MPLKDTFKEKGILRMIRENLKSVKHKVIVLGGKGGVGKSMVAVNLAASLVAQGKEVCILDQVYDCPAIPMMTGVPDDAKIKIGKEGLSPYEAYPGLKVMSTGLILRTTDVIIWYHDMKRNATEELLAATHYGELDYLILDIPAGTSSETVNALKYLPDLDGGLVVTVGSQVSQNVARKCIYVLDKAEIPVIGVLENMSGFSCPKCGKSIAPIQGGAGKNMARDENVPFLGNIRVSEMISQSLDDGKPFVMSHPDTEESKVMMAAGKTVIDFCENE
ncbi:ParA family protein [delta proteobacterium NaphS2]|nr:ParA family protein [delta proteobacterium NaphS2]